MAYVAAVLRVTQLVPWPLTIVELAGRGVARPGLAIAAYGVLCAWSLAWTVVVLTRKAIPPRLVPVDVGVTAICLVLGGFATDAADVASWANPAAATALAVAAASAAAGTFIGSGTAIAFLTSAYLGGAAHGLGQTWAAAAYAVCTLVGVGVLAAVVCRYLLGQAAIADETAVELAAAQARSAAEQSRQQERARQYRMLHDTVLSTLSTLARGGLDISDPLIRQRCAADADYLRGLISSDGVSAGNHLQGELAAIGRSQAALGLRVHVHSADIPVDLPARVVRAMSDATREALNNVIKHSGVNQAWVTAFGPASHQGPTPVRLTLTITDRGRGFDPMSGRQGLGLRESITGRLREVGGTAVIDSSPGQGTTVELTWPA
jgi:signal transduction histidine kinase